MGQYWYLISVDSGEYVNCGKLTEAIANGEAALLPYMIVRQCIEPLGNAFTEDNKNHHNPLLSLPWELLLSIFEQVDLLSVLRLSLTSKRSWQMGWPYVRAAMVGRWRGTRLICEGDDNRPAHLPADVLSSEELDLLNSGLDEDELDNEEGFRTGPVTLATLMRARGEEVELDLGVDPEVRELFYAPSCSLPEAERIAALDFLDGSGLRASISSTKHWTLRNTTIKRFVLGWKLNAAFHPGKRSAGLDLPYPGFGEALLSQISWSESEASSLDLNRGDWAGHRFEIVTDEEHLLDTEYRLALDRGERKGY